MLMLVALACFGAAPATAGAPNLSRMLLTVRDMPTGWSVDNSPSGSSDVGCLSHLTPIGVKKTASAKVAFTLNGQFQELTEGLVTYASPAGKVFEKAVSTLDGCKTLSGTSDGHKVTGSVGAMSFPRVGDQSAAWSVTLELEGFTAGVDVLIVRKGPVLAVLAAESFGSPDIAQFQRFVRKALAKIS